MISKTVGTKLSVFLTALIFLASSTLGYAAPPSDAPQNKIDELLTLIEKQSLQLKEQQQAIEAQDQRFLDYQQKMEILLEQQQANIAELQSRIGAPGTATPSRGQLAKAPSTITTAGPPTPEYSATQHKTDDEGQPAPETAGPIQPVGRPPEPPKDSLPPEVAAIFDQPGVLTPKGSLILEPSLLSSHSSSKRISLHGYTIIPAITIGLIDVLAISRDTYVAALSTRYGLLVPRIPEQKPGGNSQNVLHRWNENSD
ncbi:MAG: hypothetical protein KAT62_02900 [Desulfuromonadales bacterium]|nr:hypothetical protein [Desulfuromonadales bacterium]